MRVAELPVLIEQALRGITAQAAANGTARSGNYLSSCLHAQQEVYENHAQVVMGDLLTLFADYDTLSAEAGDWVTAKLFSHVDSLAAAAVDEVSRRARIVNIDGKAFEERVPRWASRLKQRLDREVRYQVGEARLKSGRDIAPSRPEPVRPEQRMEPVDDHVLAALRDQVPDAADSYEQALRDINGPDRCSWKGPANDLREALRVTLHTLAPTEEVIAAPWYVEERQPQPGMKPGPTLRQRARYVLRKRGASDKTATTEHTAEVVEEQYAALVTSVYDRGNRPAHAGVSPREVEKLHALVRVALSDLLGID
jgi:hypothetical protein